jgi:hypothetical protein
MTVKLFNLRIVKARKATLYAVFSGVPGFAILIRAPCGNARRRIRPWRINLEIVN